MSDPKTPLPDGSVIVGLQAFIDEIRRGVREDPEATIMAPDGTTCLAVDFLKSWDRDHPRPS